MYQRRLNYSSKKRKYPYSKKSYGRSKYRRSNNASSYFTYDGPRAKSITRLNAAIGAELKQYYHEFEINHAYTAQSYWVSQVGGVNVYNKPFLMIPAANGDPAVCAPLPKIIQGQTYDKRIGDKITIKSIDFRLRPEYLTELASYTNQVQDIAVWIVLDKNPNGVGAKWTDIFHGQTCTPLSQKHMKNENRFQILKTFYIPNCGQWAFDGGDPLTRKPIIAQGTLQSKFLYYKMKKPLMVKYQSSTGNDGSPVDIVENNIYVIVTTKSPVGAVALHGSMNVRFYDS